MDVKREIKIEDEFSDFTESDASNSRLEQGLEEKEIQKMDNLKNEIEVKSEPIYILEEDISKDQLFEDISGLDKSPILSRDEGRRKKGSRAKGPLKNGSQSKKKFYKKCFDPFKLHKRIVVKSLLRITPFIMEKYGLQFEDSQPMFVCKNCLSKIIVKWKHGNTKSSYSSENLPNTSSCSFISTPEMSMENVPGHCSAPTRNAMVQCPQTKNAESQYSAQVKDSANQCNILTSSIGVQCEIDTQNTLRKMLYRKVVRKKSWHIRYLKQRNKMLRAKIGRKNIKPMKTSIEMFNFCSENLPILTTELFKSQLAKEFDAKHRWTNELKNECLSVYLKSPKAYKVLKQALKLPSVDTLIQFLKRASVTPGFEHQLNNNLKNAVEDLSEFDRCVVLLMDEIDLTKNLRFNGEYIVGLEDFGYDQRTSLPASSALCFMVRSMSGNWMQLIGYAFSHGPMKLKGLKFLFEKCLLKLNEIGLKVMCITTNQRNNFASLLKTLGVTKCKPYFHRKISDVNYKYIVIPDVPHLLKSTRNAIFNNSISTPEGMVKWQYIEEAYNLKVKSNFPYIPKVSEIHVKLPSLDGKRKVKLAAQILSRSVSEALQTMRMEGLSDENSLATEQFCLKINNLFDILNSSPSQKGRTPFHQKLQDGSKGWEYISDIKSWIECWEIFRPRDSQGQCKVTSRFRFVNGWIQAINGVIELLKELKNFNFHYIYTRRLCLDPLENCFGDIRGVGGLSDDPTCSQFEARFQRIAVNFLLQIA